MKKWKENWLMLAKPYLGENEIFAIDIIFNKVLGHQPVTLWKNVLFHLYFSVVYLPQ